MKKSRDQTDLQDQLLEEPLALVFAHGVAEGDGVRKKNKYGPKKRKCTSELGGEVVSDSSEISTPLAGAVGLNLPQNQP